MQKQITDIPKIKTTATTHISYKYSCDDCGKKFDSISEWSVPGTSMRPHLAALSMSLWDNGMSVYRETTSRTRGWKLSMSLWDNGMSVGSITETLDCFEAGFCKGTVDNALGAITYCKPVDHK